MCIFSILFQNSEKIVNLQYRGYTFIEENMEVFILKGFLQKFGKSLLMPISTLAAAGLILGLAAMLQNPSIVGESFSKLEAVQNIIGYIRKLAGFIFGSLPVFFAISVTAGMAKEEKVTAVYSSVLGFFIFHLTLNYMLGLKGINADTTSVKYLTEQGMTSVQASLENARYETVFGFLTYRMNVFAGVIIGLVVAELHNRFHKIELPSMFNFFGGKRFVPIITIVAVPFVALISYYVWPYFDFIISLFGKSIEVTGIFGPFIYGFLNRLLIPTGLHHILNQLVRFTNIGGSTTINGEVVTGALNIYNATLVNNSPVDVVRLGTRFVGQGHMIIAMFGLPAAALAIIKTSFPENKKYIKSLMLAAIAASFVTGITEPIEFSFIFISPVLFLFHAVMTGLAYMIMAVLGVAVGNIQAGIIDFFIFGVFRGMDTRWFLVIIVGIIYGFIYYKVFVFFIMKFNVNTPGRENLNDDDESEGKELAMEDKELSETIIRGLGGTENIADVENCFTRLRVQVLNPEKINETVIKSTRPSGIVRPEKNYIHIIYGLKVEGITKNLKEYIKSQKEAKN